MYVKRLTKNQRIILDGQDGKRIVPTSERQERLFDELFHLANIALDFTGNNGTIGEKLFQLWKDNQPKN